MKNSIQALAVLAIIFSSPIRAETPDFLLGSWAGSTMTDSGPIGVDMKLNTIKVNVKGGEFHYGEPRACRLQMAYIASDSNKHWFALSEPTGGYCDKLFGKRIVLIQGDDPSSIQYELKPDGTSETGNLQKN
jgi:hypothetical protein